MDKKWGLIGLGNIFDRTKNILLNIPQIKITAVSDINEEALQKVSLDVFKTNDYTLLVDKCDVVIISTPPATHFKIAKFFMEKGIDVVVEKPLTANLKELEELERIALQTGVNFYSMLHYSFGKEILWWEQNGAKFGVPNKIESVFDDLYYGHGALDSHAIGLGGAYIDSTINSLSGIYRLFEGKLTPKSLNKIYDSKTGIDVYALSKYNIELAGKNIPVQVEIDWRHTEKRRGIFLYYPDKVIFLDGKNQQVFDMQTNEVLYKADGISIENHYDAMLRDCAQKLDNKSFTFPLHKAILQNLALEYNQKKK